MRERRTRESETERASEARLTRYFLTFRYEACTACDLDSLPFGGRTHATFSVRLSSHRKSAAVVPQYLLIDGVSAPDQDRDSRFYLFFLLATPFQYIGLGT